MTSANSSYPKLASRDWFWKELRDHLAQEHHVGEERLDPPGIDVHERRRRADKVHEYEHGKPEWEGHRHGG